MRRELTGPRAAAYRARKGLAPGPADMELGAARMKSATAQRAAPWWQGGEQGKGGLAFSKAGSLAFQPGAGRPQLVLVVVLRVWGQVSREPAGLGSRRADGLSGCSWEHARARIAAVSPAAHGAWGSLYGRVRVWGLDLSVKGRTAGPPVTEPAA